VSSPFGTATALSTLCEGQHDGLLAGLLSLYMHAFRCARSSWQRAYDYLVRGAAEVVSQSAVEARSAAELLAAVAARAPQSAWRQFLAERRAVDCEGCCRPNGIVETLLAELRLLPLYAVLAKPALPCSPAPSGMEHANGSGPGERHELQVRFLTARIATAPASTCAHWQHVRTSKWVLTRAETAQVR